MKCLLAAGRSIEEQLGRYGGRGGWRRARLGPVARRLAGYARPYLRRCLHSDPKERVQDMGDRTGPGRGVRRTSRAVWCSTHDCRVGKKNVRTRSRIRRLPVFLPLRSWRHDSLDIEACWVDRAHRQRGSQLPRLRRHR